MNTIRNKEFDIEYNEEEPWTAIGEDVESVEQWIDTKKANSDIVIETEQVLKSEFGSFTELKAIKINETKIITLVIFSVYPTGEIKLDNDNIIFVSDGTIYKINLSTEKVLKRNLDLDIAVPIDYIKDGYFVTDTTIVYCLDKDLNLRWKFDTKEEIEKIEMDYFNETVKIIDFDNNYFLLDFEGKIIDT